MTQSLPLIEVLIYSPKVLLLPAACFLNLLLPLVTVRSVEMTSLLTPELPLLLDAFFVYLLHRVGCEKKGKKEKKEEENKEEAGRGKGKWKMYEKENG